MKNIWQKLVAALTALTLILPVTACGAKSNDNMQDVDNDTNNGIDNGGNDNNNSNGGGGSDNSNGGSDNSNGGNDNSGGNSNGGGGNNDGNDNSGGNSNGGNDNNGGNSNGNGGNDNSNNGNGGNDNSGNSGNDSDNSNGGNGNGGNNSDNNNGGNNNGGNNNTTTGVYRKYIRSTTDSLTVRKGASTSSAAVGTIDKNDMLSYSGSVGNWYVTTYKNTVAYVSMAYAYEVTFSVPENAATVIAEGEKLLGFSYVYGAQRYHWGSGSLNVNFVFGQFDCSSLTQYVYCKGANINLATTSRAQYEQGTAVSNLSAGDLMFFTNSYGANMTGINRIRHVGIYLGYNYILHTASDYAVIEPISDVRWGYYIGARRVLK